MSYGACVSHRLLNDRRRPPNRGVGDQFSWDNPVTCLGRSTTLVFSSWLGLCAEAGVQRALQAKGRRESFSAVWRTPAHKNRGGDFEARRVTKHLCFPAQPTGLAQG